MTNKQPGGKRAAETQSKAASLWPAGIVVFFLIVAAFQAAVLYIAFAGRNALIEDEPYERGLAYEKTIEALSRVKRGELFLTAEVSDADSEGLRQVTLTIITGADALPAFQSQALASFKRPARGAADAAVILKQTGGGRYQGAARLEDKGLWLLEVRVFAAGKEYLFREQITLT